MFFNCAQPFSLKSVSFLVVLFIKYKPLLYEDHGEDIVISGDCFNDATSALLLAKLRAEEKAKRFSIIQLNCSQYYSECNFLIVLFIFNQNKVFFTFSSQSNCFFS